MRPLNLKLISPGKPCYGGNFPTELFSLFHNLKVHSNLNMSPCFVLFHLSSAFRNVLLTLEKSQRISIVCFLDLIQVGLLTLTINFYQSSFSTLYWLQCCIQYPWSLHNCLLSVSLGLKPLYFLDNQNTNNIEKHSCVPQSQVFGLTTEGNKAFSSSQFNQFNRERGGIKP